MKTEDKEEILRYKLLSIFTEILKMQIKIKIKQVLICETDPDI